MARLKKGLWKTVCMLAVLVVVAAFCSQTAFAKKNRLSVGFNVEEALNSTQLNETWKNEKPLFTNFRKLFRKIYRMPRFCAGMSSTPIEPIYLRGMY